MESRELKHLHHEMQILCIRFEQKLKAEGISFVRACTFRSFEAQERLYAQGRTTEGPIVTYAKAGQSKHNFMVNNQPASLAADYYPLINGKLADNKTAAELSLWRNVAAIAESVGLKWGGRWDQPRQDYPHFEIDYPFSSLRIEEIPTARGELAEMIEQICEQLEKVQQLVDTVRDRV